SRRCPRTSARGGRRACARCWSSRCRDIRSGRCSRFAGCNRKLSLWPPVRIMPATMADGPKYKRVLLKISGEGFCPEGGFGIEGDELNEIARECVEVAKSGVQLAVVVGGGNFIRGATFSEEGNIPRATADYMGMLATVLNAVALQETMEAMGQPTRVMSAISVYSVCEPFLRRRAIRHLEKGRAIILAAG